MDIRSNLEWFEPINFNEWTTRAFGLRPILLILLIIGIISSELRFDWIERFLGTYLVKTNSERPKSGSIWDVGHHKTNAQETLEKIITDRLATQREVRDASTLVQIAKNISSEAGGVMMSPEHFKELYSRMPSSIAQKIVSPLELLRFINDERWDRTYIEKKEQGMIIYLLDRQNRVLRQLDISADILFQIKQQEVAQNGTLENLTKFENRIYIAERFFEALDYLPEDVRRSVVPYPEVLLKTPGRIVRVGISDEAISGFIELGFEYVFGEQKKLIFLEGHDWAVWLLRSKLEGKKLSARQFSGKQTIQAP